MVGEFAEHIAKQVKKLSYVAYLKTTLMIKNGKKIYCQKKDKNWILIESTDLLNILRNEGPLLITLLVDLLWKVLKNIKNG